jgi:hypothetical protein
MRWSLTSLQTFEQCGFKYKLKYIDKQKEARSVQATRGVDNHKLVEDFVSGKIDILPTDLEFYTQFFTGLRQHEIYPEHRIAVDREWVPVDWDDPDAWYRCVIDLQVVYPDAGSNQPHPLQIANYDWKTGKIYPDHQDQKELYALATFAESPTVRRVRSIHVYLDLGTNREVTFDRDQMHSLRDRYENRVAKMEGASEYIPNPGFYCRWCGFSKAKGGPCIF